MAGESGKDKGKAKGKKEQKAARRVKNPETFRQRAQKAVEASEQPTKATKLKAGGAKATGPIRRTARKVADTKAVKPLRKPARVLGKVLVPSYFRGSWAELKQVTWPTRKESRQLTTAVLIFAVVFGAVVAAVDWGLDKIFRQLILR